jgi:polyvinyl alcohol dehydrogenase (cytochrome)
MGLHLARVAVPAAAVAAATLAAACTSGSPGGARTGQPAPHPRASRTAAAGRATNWTMYHRDPARTGFAPGLPAAGPLAVSWSRSLDGAVYGQPLVIGNLVIAATEDDSLYGLDRTTGEVRWKRHLAAAVPLSALPCGDIDPIGITSTPVLYRGLVYALAQAGRFRHILVGVDPATGRVRYDRAVPSPDGKPFYDQQRGALAAGHGRVYVTFGGHFGDCGPYVGSVVGMPAGPGRSRVGAIVSYLVPTSDHGGIWAPGGPAADRHGTLFVGVGNGAISGRFDDTDSVTALTPDLRRTGVFAPVTWPADNRADLDLGSLTPALTGGGQLLMAGKRGTIYLLSPRHLGGVGGQLAQRRLCPAFGATAVAGSMVIVPCATGGVAAVLVRARGMRVLWRGPPGASGSPVIGGGAVWVTDNDAGVLYELRLGTGQVMAQIRLGSQLPHFTSPSLSGRLALVGTLHGVVAVTGA